MSSERSIAVTIRLYSILRERDGRVVNRLELDLPEGSHVADVLSLLDVPADLEVVLAINDQIASEASPLHNHDRLAIIPAIAGGG